MKFETFESFVTKEKLRIVNLYEVTTVNILNM